MSTLLLTARNFLLNTSSLTVFAKYNSPSEHLPRMRSNVSYSSECLQRLFPWSYSGMVPTGKTISCHLNCVHPLGRRQTNFIYANGYDRWILAKLTDTTAFGWQMMDGTFKKFNLIFLHLKSLWMYIKDKLCDHNDLESKYPELCTIFHHLAWLEC